MTKDIPPFQLWYGSPAIHRGYITEHGERLDLDLKAGGRQYVYEAGMLKLL
ncbi:MAG: hypothetical protein ACWA6U_09705 [Breznakibacter sp.]